MHMGMYDVAEMVMKLPERNISIADTTKKDVVSAILSIFRHSLETIAAATQIIGTAIPLVTVISK